MTSSDLSAACPRCGTFAPQTPYWGQPLCAECVARGPRDFVGAVTVSGLFRTMLTLLPRTIVPVMLVNFVAAIPFSLLEFSGANVGAFNIVERIVDLYVGGASVFVIVTQAVEGGPVSFPRAFGQVGRSFGLLFTSNLLAGIYGVLFGLLFIVPGVLRVLSYAITAPVVLFEPPMGANKILRTSDERLEGHRWAAFGAYFALATPTVLVPMALYLGWIVAAG